MSTVTQDARVRLASSTRGRSSAGFAVDFADEDLAGGGVGLGAVADSCCATMDTRLVAPLLAERCCMVIKRIQIKSRVLNVSSLSNRHTNILS